MGSYLANEADAEPLGSFAQARTAVAHRNVDDACAILMQITRTQTVESRHLLQAWHFLRELDRAPAPDVEKQVLGVIVEVAMDHGLDVLAAYADQTVRYYNYSGAAAIWDRPNRSLDGLVDAVIEAGRALVPQIGRWDGPRRPAPTRGNVRLNILTPMGLCFGEGPFGMIDRDPRGRPLLKAATSLMRRLIEATRGHAGHSSP